MPEPLRVLGHPGVVRAGLQRVVERHLEAGGVRGGDEGVEVLERAQVGVNGGVPAAGAADRPRAARVVGPGLEAVVAALAKADADGVDGGQVDHVEAHLGDRREPRRGAAEGAVPAAVPLRAREELVPGGEAGELAVDPQREGPRHRRRGPVDGAPHQRHRGGAPRRGGQGLGLALGAQRGGESGQRAAIRVADPGPRRAAVGHAGALLELIAQLLARGQPPPQVAQPAAVVVGHGDDLEAVRADPGRHQAGRVAIVLGQRQGQLPPSRGRLAGNRPRRRPAMTNPGEQEVGPVGDHHGADLERQPEGGLGGEASAVDRGADALDRHAPIVTGHCAAQPSGRVRREATPAATAADLFPTGQLVRLEGE